MKRALCIFIILSICLSVFGCTVTKTGDTSKTADQTADTAAYAGSGTEAETGAVSGVDVDLTVLSSTMVYSEVYNMTVYPDEYLGKTVKMRGSFAYAKGDDKYYFACIIADATACCSQGIEFVLADEKKFPDEYPELDTEITVTGVFDTYFEGKNMYCQLINAVME